MSTSLPPFFLEDYQQSPGKNLVYGTDSGGNKGWRKDSSLVIADVGLSVVATMDIPAFSVVTSQGKVADSGNVSQSRGKVIGVASAAISNGFSGQVIENGPITNPAWTWTTGDIVFLNGTALSNTAPATGFTQQIGTALGPTIILVELGQPFTL